MIFNSSNPWMTQSAKEIPDDENTVVFMRHAERYSDPPDGDYSHLMLTPNGIKMAQDIGSSIDRKIRIIKSSPVGRCIQTITEIVKSTPENLRPALNPETDSKAMISHSFCKILGDPRPKEQGGVGWYEYFHFLQEHDTNITRGITLEAEAKLILDAIFSQTLDSPECTGLPKNSNTKKPETEKASVDLICSHDSHIVILASALFNLKTPVEWSEEWCKWAEGLFFYGTRNNFTAFWRGQKKSFKDYLI